MAVPTEDRAARLAEIRRQVAAGTYETPGKISAAVDEFLRLHHTGEGSAASDDLSRQGLSEQGDDPLRSCDEPDEEPPRRHPR